MGRKGAEKGHFMVDKKNRKPLGGIGEKGAFSAG